MKESRDFYNLKELLIMRGFHVSDDYIAAAVEYIDMQPESYTIFQWLKDTMMNYPEELRRDA